MKEKLVFTQGCENVYLSITVPNSQSFESLKRKKLAHYLRSSDANSLIYKGLLNLRLNNLQNENKQSECGVACSKLFFIE